MVSMHRGGFTIESSDWRASETSADCVLRYLEKHPLGLGDGAAEVIMNDVAYRVVGDTETTAGLAQ